jgi:hypothetical protein
MNSSTMKTEMEVGTRHLFVVEGRWVFVGTVRGESLTHIHLDGAQCVRRWGTTNGLAQLAVEGPQAGTILESASQCSIRKDKVLFTLNTSW